MGVILGRRGARLQPVFSPHGHAQAVGGHHLDDCTLFEKFPNRRDINALSAKARRAGRTQRRESLASFTHQGAVLRGRAVSGLTGAQQEPATDKGVGENIQPN
jgi:hypothetical protein